MEFGNPPPPPQPVFQDHPRTLYTDMTDHKKDQEFATAVYHRLLANITTHVLDPQVVRGWHRAMFPSSLTVCQQKFPSGTCIPQRTYCQGAAIPEGAAGQRIMFAMADGMCFPAELALAGQCDLLVDGGGVVFNEPNHTINLRIEVFGLLVTTKPSLIPYLRSQWPGYNGWGAQVSVMYPR